MKRFLVLLGMLTVIANTVGCDCFSRCFRRNTCVPCAPACMPACGPAVSYGDCGPAPAYGGATVVEPYIGSPTPAAPTTVTPAPMSYTPVPN